MAQPNTSVSGHKPARIFYGWWLVLVSAIGIMLSSGSVLTFTFGVFFLPLNEEFGWSRTQISLGYSLMALAFGLLQPWIGKLIDRYTARKVILPSVVLVGVLLMSLRFLTAELWFFYVVFGVLGALGAGTGMAGYVNVISHWFDRRRGLALGLTIGGFGLGASAMPTLAHRLITELGWRGAYFALGVMVILITVPVVGLFLRETPQQMGLLPDGESVADDVGKALPIEQQGLRFGDVWRTATFWHMVVAVFADIAGHPRLLDPPRADHHRQRHQRGDRSPGGIIIGHYAHRCPHRHGLPARSVQRGVRQCLHFRSLFCWDHLVVHR